MRNEEDAPFPKLRLVLSLVAVLLFCIFISLNIEWNFTREETSPEVITEKAAVADLVYTPANHSLELNPTFTLQDNEPQLGFSLDSVDLPERYAVVFKCQHGKFIIQKDQKKTKELWGRLTEGQEVTVRYSEVYKVTERGKLNGPKKFVKRELLKYDFLGVK